MMMMHTAASAVSSVARKAGPHKVFVYAFLGTANTCRPMRLALGEYGVPYLFEQRGEEDDVVPGELWEVDDAGLDALDVLEGVEEGMYSRLELDVEVWWRNRDACAKGDEEGEEPWDPPEKDAGPRGEAQMVSAFGYVAGPASLARGVGSPRSGHRTLGAYSLEVHEAEYVPKHRRAAGSLGTSGGGTDPHR